MCMFVFSDRRSLSMVQYSDWFKAPVTRWIKIAKYKAMGRIRKAVELDKVSNYM